MSTILRTTNANGQKFVSKLVNKTESLNLKNVYMCYGSKGSVTEISILIRDWQENESLSRAYENRLDSGSETAVKQKSR